MKTKLNVLYIVENYGTISETFVKDLAKYLSKNSNEFSLVVSRNQVEGSNDLNIIETKFAVRLNIIIKPFEIIFSKFGLRNFIYSFKKYLSKVSLFKKIKIIRPDIAYIDFGFNALLSRQVLEELNIPYVVHFHGVDATSMFDSMYYEKEMDKVFRGAEKIITASEHIRKRLIIFGCPEYKVQVVRLGIDIDRIDSIIDRDNRTKFPSFLHVGRLVNKKSPLPVLYSFKILLNDFPDAKFYIIGDGPEYQKIKNLIEKLELDNSVVMYGSKNSEFVWRKMAESWIFVQHSCTSNKGDQEGFSVGIIEASFCGLPVVSTIHNGIPENIIDGKTGFLVQEHDFNSFASKMKKLVNDDFLRKEMSKAGELNVRNNYFIDKRGASILDILKKSV